MNDPQALNERGVLLANEGKLEEALACFQKAVAIKPDFPRALNNLGSMLQMFYRFEEAIEHHKAALALAPDNISAMNNLSMALRAIGKHEESARVARAAVALAPGHSLSHNNLAIALQNLGKPGEAETHFRISLQHNPDPATLANLGGVFFETGRLDECLDAFGRAIAAGLTQPEVFRSRLHALHYHPRATMHSIYEAHKQWRTLFAPGNPAAPTPAAPEGRRLRIGFVSPDFHQHPVGRFMAPLLENLDRSRFEVFCYSDCLVPDALTHRIAASADHWVPTVALDHSRLARRIREDSIHILFDLTLHNTGSRLLAFAERPAPLQATWLGYCSTSGLVTMDYRISDPHMDPVGLWEAYYSEKTVRLPNCFWCYPAPEESPEIEPQSTNAGGFVFGCLNSVSKINDAVLDVWSEAMKRVVNSRLLLSCSDDFTRSLLIRRFANRGIDASRIEFVGALGMKEYLSLYNRIDLVLDPFPYNGGTTTFDALWMGAGVLTLAGDRPMGRAGTSILRNLGLTSWIANDAREYVKMAAEAPGRLEELGLLRKSLRQRMRDSSLMDMVRFARDFESLVLSLWDEKHRHE